MLVRYIIVAVLGYILGSIPMGYLVVKVFKGEDVRRYGSGRTGGTNVLRAAGPWAAALTILGDAFKGIVAVFVARVVVGAPLAEVIAGVLAVVGHNWSIFMGLRGGAGTVTNLAAMSMFSLPGAAIVVVAGFLALVISRTASVASLVVAWLAPLAFAGLALFAHLPWVYALYGVLSGIVVTIALRPNIARLRAGTERRLEAKY